jgi:hypothetical protein
MVTGFFLATVFQFFFWAKETGFYLYELVTLTGSFFAVMPIRSCQAVHELQRHSMRRLPQSA